MSFIVNIKGKKNTTNLLLDSKDGEICISQIESELTKKYDLDKDICEFNLNLKNLSTNLERSNSEANKSYIDDLQTITKSDNIEKWYKFNNYSNSKYKDIIDKNIVFASNLLDDLIISTPNNIKKNINIYTFYEDSDIAGYAKDNNIYLNSKIIDLNIISGISNIKIYLETYIFIHEIFHVLEIVPTNNRNLVKMIDNRKVYIGKYGIKGYKKVLEDNDYETKNIIYIPLEDDFGPGSKHVHFEQGRDEDKSIEIPIIENVKYPIVENELMTSGYSSTSYTFLTTMTTGVLEDLGYIINNNSKYIVNKSNDFYYKLNIIY